MKETQMNQDKTKPKMEVKQSGITYRYIPQFSQRGIL